MTHAFTFFDYAALVWEVYAKNDQGMSRIVWIAENKDEAHGIVAFLNANPDARRAALQAA